MSVEELVLAELAVRRATLAHRGLAAMRLTRHVDVYASILSGRPVVAGRLDPEVLRCGLRSASLPSATTFVTVTAAILDAIVEAEPLLEMRRSSR